MKALAKGKHVLVETSCAQNRIDAKRLFDHPVFDTPNYPRLLEAVHYPFHPGWIAFKNELDPSIIVQAHVEISTPVAFDKDFSQKYSQQQSGGTELDWRFAVSVLRSLYGTESEACLHCSLWENRRYLYDAIYRFPGAKLGTVKGKEIHPGPLRDVGIPLDSKPYWTPGMFQLDEFVNRIRYKEGAGVFIDDPDVSIGTARMVDMGRQATQGYTTDPSRFTLDGGPPPVDNWAKARAKSEARLKAEAEKITGVQGDGEPLLTGPHATDIFELEMEVPEPIDTPPRTVPAEAYGPSYGPEYANGADTGHGQPRLYGPTCGFEPPEGKKRSHPPGRTPEHILALIQQTHHTQTSLQRSSAATTLTSGSTEQANQDQGLKPPPQQHLEKARLNLQKSHELHRHKKEEKRSARREQQKALREQEWQARRAKAEKVERQQA
ncbi:hypothetical protein N0V88_005328 [Collariella sp. IMI 366227]|nr:hypothetical protein N0V88_005328 [Collariella sp. IMI 366227]